MLFSTNPQFILMIRSRRPSTFYKNTKLLPLASSSPMLTMYTFDSVDDSPFLAILPVSWKSPSTHVYKLNVVASKLHKRLVWVLLSETTKTMFWQRHNIMKSWMTQWAGAMALHKSLLLAIETMLYLCWWRLILL